jgi:hypothetical protein
MLIIYTVVGNINAVKLVFSSIALNNSGGTHLKN